ncbi:MAG: hypothetical protein MZV64_16835 [Ignavibacteriales bacterium]|nr:hypothetical protein [Ignavibacteriales bacterium]
MLRRSVLSAVGIAFVFTLFLTTADAQVRLRYAHVGSEGDIQYWYGEQAAKKIPGGDRRPRHRPGLVFPNSQLGGVQERIDGVKSGSISMGHQRIRHRWTAWRSWRSRCSTPRPRSIAERRPRGGRDRSAQVGSPRGVQQETGGWRQHAHRRAFSAEGRGR